MAASLLLAALLGYGGASLSYARQDISRSLVVAPDTTSRFLLLLYDTNGSDLRASPEEIARSVAEHGAWARTLRDHRTVGDRG